MYSERTTSWNFDWTRKYCSRCMHDINDKNEIERANVSARFIHLFQLSGCHFVVSIHFMVSSMCCRCPCTWTSFLGYVNWFCMIASSHFCKLYVIMTFLWKCLGETLLIGNLLINCLTYGYLTFLLLPWHYWWTFGKEKYVFYGILPSPSSSSLSPSPLPPPHLPNSWLSSLFILNAIFASYAHYTELITHG